MITTILLVLWGASFTGCMARWSKRYQSGVYGIRGNPDADEAFLGHLALGAIPILGAAYLFGAWSLAREQAELKRQKELAAAEARADRILSEHGGL